MATNKRSFAKLEKHIAFISVGSNLGDRLKNCHKGITSLTERGICQLIAQSRIYATEPVDHTEQDWFINMMIKLETALDPFELLDQIKTIERQTGRIQHPIRFGPRILDLDIIFYNDRVIDSERLVVPHPRMHKRRFVLKPICDIDPTIIHPVLKLDMQSLLNNLGEDEQKVIEYQWSNS